jgi:hypothetical protein
MQNSKGLDALAVALGVGTEAPQAAHEVVKAGPVDTHHMHKIKDVDDQTTNLRKKNSQAHYHRLFQVGERQYAFT